MGLEQACGLRPEAKRLLLAVPAGFGTQASVRAYTQQTGMAERFPGVHSDPEILGGTPVFVGTRVPVRALLDYLEHDRPLAEFLEDFPTVDRALAVGVLEHVKQLVGGAPPAR